jgi:hypothetical protein
VRVYLANKIIKTGGPSRFLEKLISHFKDKITFLKHDKNYKIQKKDIIFTSGSFKFLRYIKNNIIYRVDGFLWHSNYLRETTLLKYLYEKIYNINIIILINFSSIVIFQSKFVKKIWNKYLINKNKTFIIYNPPHKTTIKKNNSKIKKIICIEGSFDGAFNSIHHLRSINDYQVELYGEYSVDFKNKIKSKENIILKGHISHHNIVKILSKRNIILFCLELYPACSNSVIEAMNYGVPVFGFRTGCMNEFFGKKYKYLLDHDINDCSDNLCLKNYNLDKIFREIFINYNSISKNIFLLSRKFNTNNFKNKYFKIFNLINEK